MLTITLAILGSFGAGVLWMWAHIRQRVLRAERLAEHHRACHVHWHTAYVGVLGRVKLKEPAKLIAIAGGRKEPTP